MQKAAEELKKQQEKEAAEKKAAVDARVPKLQIDGLDKCKNFISDDSINMTCFIL